MLFLKYLFSKSFIKNLIYISITILLFFLFLKLFLRFKTNFGKYVIVPDLIGLTTDEFGKELEDLSLHYIVLDSAKFNPEFKIKSVLEQLPSAGSKVKNGRKIYITLNASDFKDVRIPKIRGYTIRQAKKTLNYLGFITGEVSYVNYIALDEVISISSNGNKLYEGDYLKKNSVIDFVLGNGKQ